MICNVYILRSEEGGLTREIELPMQELNELKMQGGLMREGGRNCGILQYVLQYGIRLFHSNIVSLVLISVID